MNFETEVNRKTNKVILIIILVFVVCMCLMLNASANTHSKRKVSKKVVKTTLIQYYENN